MHNPIGAEKTHHDSTHRRRASIMGVSNCVVSLRSRCGWTGESGPAATRGSLRIADATGHGRILIVDDEWNSPIVRSVTRRLEAEGWNTIVVQPDEGNYDGDEFERAALYAVDEERPDGVLLDVRFGEHRDDRFKGLEILRKIVEGYPKLPVLMFT